MKKKWILFLCIGVLLVALIVTGVILWNAGVFAPDSAEVVAAKKSIAEYEQILENAPQNEEANAGLITAYGDAGDLEKAREVANTAVTLLPNSKAVAKAMVSAYAKAGMYTEAVMFVSELQPNGIRPTLEIELAAEGFPGYGGEYNTPGNTVNEGRLAVSGETIYYSEPRDGGRLYSMNMEGNEKKKITESEARYIHVLKDKILYCDITNNYYCCTVNKNGSDQKALIPMMSMDYFIFDGKIYFSNWADECKIYSANLDGTEVTKVCDMGAEDLYQYGAWIYFTARDEDSVIYRVKINGEGLDQVNSDQSMLPNVYGGIVYFINWADNGTLYSVDPDNANETYRQVYNKRVGHLNINGDYLYYTDWSVGGKPHRMDLKTMERIKLGDDRAGYLIVSGDWVYYQNNDDGNRIYRVKTTGGGRKRVGG